MMTQLHGLNLVGFSNEAEEIQKRWDELISISRAQAEPEYERCFPRRLLENFAQEAHKGVAEIGCRVVTPATSDVVHSALNEAWVDFWRDPQGYAAREKGAVEDLRARCSSL